VLEITVVPGVPGVSPMDPKLGVEHDDEVNDSSNNNNEYPSNNSVKTHCHLPVEDRVGDDDDNNNILVLWKEDSSNTHPKKNNG
jgi:hypothetical protein